MTYITLPQLFAAEPHDFALETARAFFHQHRDNLLNAAMALGGERGAGRVMSLVEDLRDAGTLTRSLRKRLVALHKLLRLENVGDPDAEETRYFAEIDIQSDLVDDICRLTDAYRALLTEIDRSAAMPEEAAAERSRDAA